MRNKRVNKVKAGDLSQYPFNHAFTAQERRVFLRLDQMKALLKDLKHELARTPRHACNPPENYDPTDLEEIRDIEEAIHSLDLDLRWIPGGVHRYDVLEGA